jgi:hypothetical protein
LSVPLAAWFSGLGLALALAAGLYGRFLGLGTWSFGVDEFYISRSVDHILKTGWPNFPCGSYYTRGLLFQYLVALVRGLGLAPELGARWVSALWSLLALPAAYQLGRRLQGRGLGWLLVALLSLSVWEIEMARFARMYAPFQAVFLWYLVFFLRYVLDGERKAVIGLVTLSAVGVLTWEGGLLLGVLNLLPPFLKLRDGRLRRQDWLYLAAMLTLSVLFHYATGDPREDSLPAPEDARAAVAIGAAAAAAQYLLDAGTHLRHPGWLVLFLTAPIALALCAGKWLWSLRGFRFAACGLLVALGAALAHQFALCGAFLLLVPLAGFLPGNALWERPARSYRYAIAASLLFWLAFALVTGAWRETPLPSSPAIARWLALGQYLGGYPNVFREFVVPWGRAMPWLTLGAGALVGVLAMNTLHRQVRLPTAESVLLVTLVVTILAIGARESGRIETRYTFFLYPVVIALSLRAVHLLTGGRFVTSRALAAAPVAASLLLFGASEDFQPRHIARIDSRQVNFRVGMSASRASHYYPRADYRLVGAWMRERWRPGDTVLLGTPAIDQYYHRADYFFLQDDDPRFEVYACTSNSRERWTDLPLVHGMDALAARVAAGGRLWLLMYPGQAEELFSAGQRRIWNLTYEWVTPERSVAAILINP